MNRFATTIVLLAAFALGTGPSLMASAPAPVAKLKTKTFGYVLTRRDRQALYTWDVEKKAGGRIRCTAACAQLWPPLLVRSAAAVTKHVAGIRGVFGVIRRPDGRLQVTYNRLAVYTYAHERPAQVLCDNVDGWFVIRLVLTAAPAGR